MAGNIYENTNHQSFDIHGYPFGWFEFEIDEEGKGVGLGALIVAAKLQFNKEGQFEIVSYGIQPYQLVNIKRW